LGFVCSFTVFTIIFRFPTFLAWVQLNRLYQSKYASGASKLVLY
jgi:hypothetical protein